MQIKRGFTFIVPILVAFATTPVTAEASLSIHGNGDFTPTDGGLSRSFTDVSGQSLSYEVDWASKTLEITLPSGTVLLDLSASKMETVGVRTNDPDNDPVLNIYRFEEAINGFIPQHEVRGLGPRDSGIEHFRELRAQERAPLTFGPSRAFDSLSDIPAAQDVVNVADVFGGLWTPDTVTLLDSFARHTQALRDSAEYDALGLVNAPGLDKSIACNGAIDGGSSTESLGFVACAASMLSLDIAVLGSVVACSACATGVGALACFPCGAAVAGGLASAWSVFATCSPFIGGGPSRPN